MPRFFRRAAVLVALAASWALLAGDSLPSPIARAYASVSDDAADAKAHYDLAALKIFNRVVIQLKDSYVDPKRVNPKLMLVAALDGVEKTVAEVMVEGDEKSNSIKVTVGSASRDFDISQVDSLWKMSFTMRDVFDFISKHLVSKDQDQREIEYAAINGMLSTLDPHSILLKPDYFKEMKLQTKGEFGGLGFVIQMKESNLTVVKVLKNTPAARAGIKPKDIITKIGEESTVNMDLNDAVSRLRGKPDSKVTITVQKPGTEPKPMALTRAIIAIESVESKLLPDGVGYIRLKTFQGNSARDIEAQLNALKAKNGGALKGLVLDLRGNPGGLLEEAIRVSDLFVSEGTIVTTVGYGDKMREVKRAHAEGTEADLPLAVLVNSGSASASEIVAGALKNLNRAVIVGRQTFGKGSVQVLYDFPDESALKLTIAQYLTPGDVSIQEVGITPDVELEAAKVTKDRIEVFAPRKTMGEADLEHHLTNPADAKPFAKREDVVPKDKPAYTLEYLRAEPKKADKDKKGGSHEDVDLISAGSTDDEDDAEADAEAEDTDKVLQDFQVTFSHDLLLAAPSNDRRQIVEKARNFMAQQNQKQGEQLAAALGQLGVNWSPGPHGMSKLVAEATPAATAVNKAGETVQMNVTVRNDGDAPAFRVRGWTESENPYLDRREFVIGQLAPHEKRSWTIPVQTPKDLNSRRDFVTFKVVDDQGPASEPLKADLNFAELQKPAFAYSLQVLDQCKDTCNGDGITNPGEQVTLQVDVKNIGTGIAKDAYASIKNDSDENVFIDKGRFKLGELAPGETKTATFSLTVKKAYQGDTYALKMAIVDEPMEEYLGDRLVLPVAPSGPKSVAKTGAVKLGTLEASRGAVAPSEAGGPVAILSGARGDLPAIAMAKAGQVLPVEARIGDFYRVQWEQGRTGYVPAALAHEVGTPQYKKGEKAGHAERVFQHDEPQVTVTADTSKGGIETTADHFTLTGTAYDPAKLRDLYIFVNDQKVFFRSTGDKPDEKIAFTTDFKLKEGNNAVTVVAREDDELIGRKTLVIRRDGGDNSAAHASP
ncbi:MAG: PDZ domain-containing protein [Deltaproteobacteria bacterium]|nr:PDZ domain-containing protein [Deltaproteobacteria bacterium]